MPATRRSTNRPRTSQATRERYEKTSRVIDRVAKSLKTAQADLSAISGSLGTGASDLRRDVSKLVRDARRDVGKMSRAVRRDLERVQRDLASAAKPSSARGRRGTTTTRRASATKPRSRGSHRAGV